VLSSSQRRSGLEVQLDTYEREVERYGGPAGIRHAESLFWVDSLMAVRLVSGTLGDDGLAIRWRVAVLSMDVLMRSFGFSVFERLNIAQQAKREAIQRLGTERGLTNRLAHLYRQLREQVDDTLQLAEHLETAKDNW
jgi:thiopeptide-type bacteriocin biosynthesis protein